MAPDQEDLLRENARLRGDLMTVARRLSHDLLTPLGGIMNSNEAIREILAELDPHSIPMLTSSLNSTEELTQLIKRASFVLKATAQPMTPQPTPVGPTVHAALQRLEHLILRQGAIVFQPETWPQINGVSAWLEVIWWNLAVNALQHANAKPLRIELGWSQQSEHFQFWVADNGRGVPEVRQKLLFQPFHLLHQAEAVPGLGLSMTQRLVELQGGDCGYRNTSRGGACFYFNLA